MDTHMTIGKVASRAGVNLQTVRYYERRRMLAPARRTESGYRIYSMEAVRVIRFIKNAQALGFTLNEIARLLSLRVRHGGQCSRVRKQAQARLEIVQGKLTSLRAMEKTLRRLIRTCATKATTDACPILESLEDGR